MHERRLLASPAGWVAYVSRTSPRRLVVFVHGFKGKAVDTWRDFPRGGAISPWWRDSDLLFVRYDATSDSILGVADRLRATLPRLFPTPPAELCEAGGVRVRERDGAYEELYLVGHSLGGVIVRRALADAADAWIEARAKDPNAPRPALLAAQVRLFSPASAGFRPAGLLALLRALGMWTVVEVMVSSSSAYQDLKPGSELLRATRRRTEQLVNGDRTTFGALRAHILWADPDNVVATERYDTDPVHSTASGRSHVTVCKPDEAYALPWTFVQRGNAR